MRQKNLKLHELPYIHRNYMNCRTVHTQKWQTPGWLRMALILVRCSGAITLIGLFLSHDLISSLYFKNIFISLGKQLLVPPPCLVYYKSVK